MTPSITARRKARLASDVLASTRTPIGFVDVGSGGPLKSPWTLLPSAHLRKFDFDPEVVRPAGALPVCVSDRPGERDFYIASDPRSSSLHPAAAAFVERFGRPELLAREVVRVECTTLDLCFAGRYDQIDVIDVNAEGHDYQVLQGAAALLAQGFPKCLKVEFELMEVWQGQGWFSDLDPLLRAQGYDLAGLEVEYAPTVRAAGIYHRGEPLWGKALYVPGPARWKERAAATEAAVWGDDVRKGVALYTLLDLPGRALDVAVMHESGMDRGAPGREALVSQIKAVFAFARLDSIVARLVTRLRWQLGWD